MPILIMKKISLKKTQFDTYAFSAIIFIATILFVSLRLALRTDQALFVYVYASGEQIDRLDLSIDLEKTYKNEVFIEDITIEIKDRKVRVKEETSNLKYCSIQGYVGQIGQPIICAPNNFYLLIMGADYDEK